MEMWENPLIREQTVEKTKESGFTFLEMILVLVVLSIVTAIILPIGDKWIQTASDEDALQAFIATVHNLQAHSMANYVGTSLEFKDSGTEYITSYLKKGGGRIEIARNLFPEGMRLVSSSQLKTVEFHANGDIVRSGTIALVTSSGLIEIRFQFQRGRMIIYE
jgi:competence protein ComGD